MKAMKLLIAMAVVAMTACQVNEYGDMSGIVDKS